MIEPQWFFYGIAWPAILTAGVLAVSGLVCRRWPWVAPGPGWALGVGAGLMAGYHAVDGWPPLPPTESQHWLVMVALPIAVLLASLGPFQNTRPKWRMAVRFLQCLLAGATPAVLLQSYLQYEWSYSQAVAWLAGLAVVTIGLWLGLDQLKRRQPGRWLTLNLCIVAAGTGVCVTMSGSQTIGQLALSLAAVLAGAWLVSWVLPKQAASPATLGVAVISLAGLWINGYFYAELTTTNVILLALAPLAGWVTRLPKLRRALGWRSAVTRSVAVLIPVVIALILAGMRFQEEMTHPSYG